MDGNNVHTSVVIELANQEEPDDQKTYKIDFNEIETPKDYVIDQIFCGENLTVYALFEIPEIGGKSEGDVLEIQNTTITDDFRFIHKNSFKKSLQNKSNPYGKKLSVKDSDEDFAFSPRSDNLNQSFHCLKHLGKNYEIPPGDTESTELKVLFSNDFMSKAQRQATFKSVSKGVNTEITQSPKILEEVQRAMTLNYSASRCEGRKIDKPNIPSGKPSYEIIDIEMQPSFSSFSSVSESRKYRKRSSPNFLFVPLIMMEDRFKNHFRRDRNQTQLEEKILDAKTRMIPTKVSLGTNTDMFECSPLTSETEDRREITSQLSTRCESSKTESSRTTDTSKERNAQSQMKKKDKNAILKEIRKLQGKLNALIKSIEFNDLYQSTNEDEEYPEMDPKTSEEVMKILNEVPESGLTEIQPLPLNKFNDIPIFSPQKPTYLNKGGKTNSKKRQTANREVRKKCSVETVKSTSSSGFVSQQSQEVPPVLTVREGEEVTKLRLKSVFSGFDINWDSSEGYKVVGASKSDTNNRCNVPIPKSNAVKKSMSFVLKDEKAETCLKKMKNSAFKFEGGLKANLRIIQNKEVALGDNLSTISHEMGDEIKRKQVVSKTEVQSLLRDPEKEEVDECLKSSKADVKKTQNEEEGDAKWICPKQDLISPKYVQNPAVHYCNTSAIVTDGLMKTVKNMIPTRGKPKTANKADEPGTKTSGEPEKPITPNKTSRKSNAIEPDTKKEVKTTSRLTNTVLRNKTVEKKPQKKETILNEGTKPKPISGSRKFTVKGTAESKLHVDKLMKKLQDNDGKPEPTNNTKTSKSNAEEKSTAKNDKVSLPRSQKRETRDKTPDSSAVGKKEAEKKLTKKKSAALVEAGSCPRKSLKDSREETKMDSVMVFENMKENPEGSEMNESSAWLPSNPSSVVVELLSEKPKSVEELYAEVNQNDANGRNTCAIDEKDGWDEYKSGNSLNQEKPIVKSVWALTKVLLYEDGTKKLEVLEASLTPPGYSLKLPDKSLKERQN